jgi:hypothetical protein
MAAGRAAMVFVPVLLVTSACGDDSSDLPSGDAETVEDARQHCTESGGEALDAAPYYGTNADREQWLELGGGVELCRFENSDDGTRIYVDFVTLSSEEPTLAGLAYLAQVPVSLPERPSSNPATFNCTALGGTSQWGDGLSGGGWVTSDRPDEVFNLCVFADLSFIDEFGIFYYADGTVRGMDLSTVMRYEPEPERQIFD